MDNKKDKDMNYSDPVVEIVDTNLDNQENGVDSTLIMNEDEILKDFAEKHNITIEEAKNRYNSANKDPDASFVNFANLLSKPLKTK